MGISQKSDILAANSRNSLTRDPLALSILKTFPVLSTTEILMTCPDIIRPHGLLVSLIPDSLNTICLSSSNLIFLVEYKKRRPIFTSKVFSALSNINLSKKVAPRIQIT